MNYFTERERWSAEIERLIESISNGCPFSNKDERYESLRMALEIRNLLTPSKLGE